MPQPLLIDFTFRNLAQLQSGAVEVAFQRELERVLADIANRPGFKEKRELSLRFTLTPKTRLVPDDLDTDVKRPKLEGIALRVHVRGSVPARRTEEYDFGLAPADDGEALKLQFNPTSPFDRNQTTFQFQTAPPDQDDDLVDAVRPFTAQARAT